MSYVRKKPRGQSDRRSGQRSKRQSRLRAVTLPRNCGCQAKVRSAADEYRGIGPGAREIVKFDRATNIGFDIEIWMTVMRGKPGDAGSRERSPPVLDSTCIPFESSQVIAINYGIPSWAYVDLHWAEGKIRTRLKACRPRVFYRHARPAQSLPAMYMLRLSWSF